MNSASEVTLPNNKQARRWCFTWNNYPENWEQFLLINQLKYYCVGEETAPTTGRKHLQGYVEFTGSKRLSTLRNEIAFPIHWTICNGTQEQNVTYCSKDGNAREFGVKGEQGKRSDLSEAQEILDRGGSMLEVAENNFGSFVRYNRGFAMYQYLRQQQQAMAFRNVEVFYIHGPPGCGKTRRVYEENPGLFRVSEGNTGMWWTGYSQQEVILFDDFRGTVPLHILLQWLDVYPVQVPIHGNYTYLNARKIYITSNVPLENLYRGVDELSRQALRRRVHHIENMTPASEVTGNNAAVTFLDDHSFF